jgi:hypothetical protein
VRSESNQRRVRRLSKAYIYRWQQREKPEQHTTDFWFSSKPEKAACWQTKEEAEADCKLFNLYSIKIVSADGGTYTCKGFRAEERNPGEFVIFCEAPFVRKQSSGQAEETS